MFWGCALSFEPRTRLLRGVGGRFRRLRGGARRAAAVVGLRSSAFADPRYCPAAPTASNNPAAANSRGRNNELIGFSLGSTRA